MTSQIAAREVSTPRKVSGRTLPRRLRQTTLVVHIASGGVWIGVDVVVAVLVLTGRYADDPQTRTLAAESLATFVLWPMLGAALICLVSGLVLGIGTRWGLTRYWWVLIKLLVTVALSLAIVFALAPGLRELAADPEAMPDDMVFPPTVSLIALSFVTTLSVVKPWGRRTPRGGDSARARPRRP